MVITCTIIYNMTETNTIVLYKYLSEKFLGSKISWLGSGWSSIAFQVDELIIRFPKHGLDDYKKEQYVCNYLRNKIPFHIPDTEICQGIYPYVKHKKIWGETWNNDTLKQMSDTSRNLLAQDIVLFLSTIHMHKCPYTAPSFTPISYPALKQSILKTCPDNLSKHFETAYGLALKLSNQPKVLIHGDFFSQNSILNKNNRLYGIFDWCNCGAGDPVSDFVPLYATVDLDFVLNIIYHYQAISNKSFDFSRLKKLYLIRSMYLLYWKHHNSPLVHDSVTRELEMILQKAL